MGDTDFEADDTFRMRERAGDGRTVVELTGELDLATCDPVSARLAQLCEQRRVTVLDLDGLTFIGSSGVRLLLMACDDARRTGWSFAITRGSREVQRVLAAIGVLHQMPYLDGTDRPPG